MLGRRLSMMRIMAMRTKAVASSRSNERQNIRSLLPYCFHASGAWKQSLSLQGKLQLLQYITGAPEEIRTHDPQIHAALTENNGKPLGQRR